MFMEVVGRVFCVVCCMDTWFGFVGGTGRGVLSFFKIISDSRFGFVVGYEFFVSDRGEGGRLR